MNGTQCIQNGDGMPYTLKQKKLFYAKARDKSLSPKERAKYAKLAKEANALPTKEKK
jgi:hypothetical protein